MQVQKIGSVGTQGIESPEFFEIETLSVCHTAGKIALTDGRVISAVHLYDGKQSDINVNSYKAIYEGRQVVLLVAPFTQPGRNSLVINEIWDGTDEAAISFLIVEPELLPEILQELFSFKEREHIKFHGWNSGDIVLGVLSDGRVVRYDMWDGSGEGFLSAHSAETCCCCGNRFCRHSEHIAYDSRVVDVVLAYGNILYLLREPSEAKVLEGMVEYAAKCRRTGAFPSTGTYEGDIAPLRKPIDRLSALEAMGRMLDEDIQEIKLTRLISPSGSPQNKARIDNYWASINKSYPQYTTGEPAIQVIETLSRKVNESLVAFHARAKARADEVNS